MLDIVDKMSEKEIEDFASTKHKDVPNKIKKENKMTKQKLTNLVESIVKQQLSENTVTTPFILYPSKSNGNVILQKNGEITIHISNKDAKDFKTILKNSNIKYDFDLF